MMDVSLAQNPTLCDLCGQTRLHEVALQFVEPGVINKSEWIGGFTQEKSNKWGVALYKAHVQLQKPCLQITFDCESGCICRDCLVKLPDLFDGDKKSCSTFGG
jgi:hypothetical protein